MNKIFENGKELTTAEELGGAFYTIINSNIKQSVYDLSRIKGSICDCNGHGTFDLLPIDDKGVIEGGKRYMVCRKCGHYSHL